MEYNKFSNLRSQCKDLSKLRIYTRINPSKTHKNPKKNQTPKTSITRMIFLFFKYPN